MSGTEAVPSRGRGGLSWVVAALACTQLIGWGTTYYLPSVLSRGISSGTGLGSQAVFGGVTIMLLVAAGAAPIVGRLLDRRGARGLAVFGSLLVAAGLVLLSQASGPVSFVVAWIMIGAATPLALGQAASAAVVVMAPDQARRALTLILTFAGFSSSASWPAMIWLDAQFGWRGAILVFAAIHALVCAPLHWWALRPGRMQAGQRPDACETEPAGPAVATVEPERPVRGAFVLAAIAFSLAGFISWGIPLQLIPVLTELGHSEAAAVAVGVLFGPAQVVARFGELTFGHRVGILLIGVGAIGLLPVGLLVILTGGHTIAGAVAFAVIYGIAAGLVSVVRAVAPLRLFGRSRYARITGYLNAPQNLAFAAGPFAFAALREAFGFTAVTLSAMAVGLVAFAAMLELNRRAGRSSRPSQNAGTGRDGPRPR